ncbi:MAG: SDR family NAD(P)-dependent oxidoreductase [Deltaproteobacteria bacterium]|nr:SDR family NAD(P)-dependent oxidoreductase [Deltaproteobacteria bacterium]
MPTTAVITGAGSGLGRAFAVQLALPGARLLLADIDAAGCEETAQICRARGAEPHVTRVDVAEAAQVEQLGADADRVLGRIDLVINNAGVAVSGAVGEVPLDDWRWIVGINLWGAIHGCHVFTPRLLAQRGGGILNVASAAGIACAPTMGPYNVTKAGVIALSETLAAEVTQHGVRVTVLCPVFFPTNIVAAARGPAAQRAQAAAALANSRFTAEQVAAAALRANQRGELYCLPMREARLVWWLKRLVPQLFHQKLAAARLARMSRQAQ